MSSNSNIKESKLLKIILPILLLFVISFMVGCVRAPTRGWSGPIVVSEEGEGRTILYVGTLGDEVIALDITDANESTLPILLPGWPKELGSAGGEGLGCGGQISRPMSTYGTPVIKDDVLYIGGYDGNVYGFDTIAASRMPMIYPTDDAIIGSLTIDGDMLYIGSTDGRLYALDLDLKFKWDFKTDGEIWSTPEVDPSGKIVYISSSDHRLYAIDAVSGREIWHFEAEGAILSTPLWFDNTIYIGSCDRKFYAIEAATEAERLAAIARGEEESAPVRMEKGIFEQAESWFWTKALAYNNKIYVGNLDHSVYVLDARNIANKLDEFETGGRVRTPPVLVGESIVIGSEDGYIYIINPQNIGELPEKIDPQPDEDPELKRPPILAPLWPDSENGVVYAHAQNGDHVLYAIEVETGDRLWQFKTSE